MKHALVTGAGGFIGSHLVEGLVASGYKVRAMTHYNFANNWGWLESVDQEVMDNVEVVPSDICDPFAVRKAVEGCDVVFHLASLIAIPYSYVAPASYANVNIHGAVNILQACRDLGGVRMLHTSTSEVYGTAQYTPIDEKHPLVGQSPYSASKIGADKLAESYHLSFGLPVTTIRPFNTFGPRQSARAVIPTIITQALAGAQKVRLGSLTPVRDMNYVKDTVEGFILAAENDKSIGATINLGRGEGQTIKELAETIFSIMGMSVSIEPDDVRVRPDSSEVMRLVCDNTKAKQLLGWAPKHSLRKGLEATVDWLRGNLSAYKTHIYNY